MFEVPGCMLGGKLRVAFVGRGHDGLLFRRICHNICTEYIQHYHVDPDWFWGRRS